ncbi:MAG: malectin domain-containing carbohydrate-binding protein [Syntrophales bacterium]
MDYRFWTSMPVRSAARLLLLFLTFLFFAPVAHSADVTLAWDANSESDLAGYKVYYGTSSRNYSSRIDVGNWTGCTISGLSAGSTYYFAATAYDTGGLESEYCAEVSYTIPGQSGAAVFSVNSGGSKYTDSTGLAYNADTHYSGGWTYTTAATIAGTADQVLYRSERAGNFSYNIALANGAYNVTLKFAEIYWNAAGKRIFDVLMEGKTVVSRLDIYVRAGGKNKALDITVPVIVSDGVLNIKFVSRVDSAKVSAIVVKR